VEGELRPLLAAMLLPAASCSIAGMGVLATTTVGCYRSWVSISRLL
jgi:hypothetical protein